MPWILFCFFLSGITGLVYEVLWMRMLGHLIGAAPYAVSLVLAVFMGGLGLGGLIGGRLADRERGPGGLLRLYGILETAVGLYALCLPLILAEALPICAQLYRRFHEQPLAYHLLLFPLCALVLLPPVMCMGATLPVLARRITWNGGHWTARLGLLYGLNAVGAALGALGAGFWALESLGLSGTSWLAAGVNAAVGLLCIARGSGARDGSAPAWPVVSGELFPTASAAPATSAASLGRPHVGLALWVFALSGFCAMACEVIWTRLLGLVLGPTPYAFTLVLFTFILGLALGNLVFGRLADRAGRGAGKIAGSGAERSVAGAWTLFAATQAGAAVLVLVASQVLGNSPVFFSKLAVTFRHGFWIGRAWEAVALSLFMFPPAMALGAAFPLMVRLGFRPGGEAGRFVGRAYAANTAGGVLGSLGAGFLLIPWLGKEGGLAVVAGVQALGALALALAGPRSAAETARGAGGSPGGTSPLAPSLRFLRSRWAACALACAAILLACRLPRWDRQGLSRSAYYEAAPSLLRYGWAEALFLPRHRSAGPSGGEEVYYGDGVGGFTTVWKTTGPLGDEDFTLFNSGKADASAQADMFTQALCAHFPMLFHPAPRSVMVLGLASGITAGEILHYPVASLDVLEINRQVVGASRFFARWNNGVMADPRTRLILEDGKAHLTLTDRRYDVIVSEPSNPWMAGLAELYSLDFFRTARARLNPDGVFVQFLHSYQMDWDTFALVGRTFARAFPRAMLVRTLPGDGARSGPESDYLLVGCNGEGRPAREAVLANLAHARRSGNVDLRSADVIFRMIETDDLAGLFGEGPVHTDDRPVLEFAAPRLIYTDAGDDIRGRIRSRARLSPRLRALAGSADRDVERQIDFAAYALSVFRPFPGMVDLERADPEQRARYLALVAEFCGAYSVADFALFQPLDTRRACVAAQVGGLRRRLSAGREEPGALVAMASLYEQAGAWKEALPIYRRALASGAAGDPGLAAVAQGRLDALAAALAKGGKIPLSGH
jgi:spermidine synthase